jgi:hypothetical protein
MAFSFHDILVLRLKDIIHSIHSSNKKNLEIKDTYKSRSPDIS